MSWLQEQAVMSWLQEQAVMSWLQEQGVMSWLQELNTDFFYAGIDSLVYRWDKCLGKYGDYVEK
jgi:hypothetical protein